MAEMMDVRDQAARDALLESLEERNITADLGWDIKTEQSLTRGESFVLRLGHPLAKGHATVEASGYRQGGGHEYFVSVFDEHGGLEQGPLRFSYPATALQFARLYLLA